MRYHCTHLEWCLVTTPSAEEDEELQELSLLSDGVQNGTATLEESLAASHKTKHTLTVEYNNHTPQYLHKGIEGYVYTKTWTQMFIKT